MVLAEAVYYVLIYASNLKTILTFLVFLLLFYSSLVEIHYAIFLCECFWLSGRLWGSPKGKRIMSRSYSYYFACVLLSFGLFILHLLLFPFSTVEECQKSRGEGRREKLAPRFFFSNCIASGEKIGRR